MKKVLLVGAGTMGSVHADAYMQMENVSLEGIVDFNKEAVDKLAEQTKTTAFYSFDEALEQLKDIDVVDVCLPTYLHLDYVKKAANAVENVICEKPLATSLEEAREMIDYCKKQNVKLFVGHVVRFFPEYKRAKQLVEAGTVGKPAVVRTTRGGVFPTGWTDWYTEREKSGGLILDLIIHDFDYLRWCFGDVERVYAKSLSRNKNLRLDYALVTLRFQSGVIAHVEGTWAHEGFSSKIEIAGKEGIIDYDSAEVVPVQVVSREKKAGAAGVAVPESPLKENPYFQELKHFLDCIETGEKPIVTAEDGYKAMEIAIAAQQSSETGKPITLSSKINA